MAGRWYVLVACVFLTGCRGLVPGHVEVVKDRPFRYPEASCGKGTLQYLNGLPVLRVEGSPEDIGSAVGALALRPAWRMAAYPEDLLRHFYLGWTYRPFLNAGRQMAERFPDDYQRELEAVARGAGIDPDRVVVGNTLFDLKKFLACSALLVEASRSTTGGPLLGRNLDYPPLGYAHEYSLVTVYHPEKARHAFVSVGFPGLVGCLSGMNDAGLALAVLEVFQTPLGVKRFDRSGMPYALCYRRILEECATIAEARALLEKMPRTTITNLVLADRQGVAVFEVSPEYVLVRPPAEGTCVCTNHYCTDELRPWWRLNIYRTLDRYRALDEVQAQTAQVGLSDLRRGLHAASQPNETMQTMIFEPATLRLHLAIGTCPSSAGEMRTLELAPLFRRQDVNLPAGQER